MRRLFILLAGTVAVMALLTACASRIDADYGTSQTLAKINQIHNPRAEKNLEPVTGMDGTAVQNVMDVYHDGFKEKQAAPAFTFDIGGGSGK